MMRRAPLRFPCRRADRMGMPAEAPYYTDQIREVMTAAPRAFELVYQGSDPAYRAYRVDVGELKASGMKPGRAQPATTDSGTEAEISIPILARPRTSLPLTLKSSPR